jgi:transposase InsO family protein
VAEEARDRLLHAYALEAHEWHRLEALATGEYMDLCALIVAQGGEEEEAAANAASQESEPGSWELFAEHAELGRLTPADWQCAQEADSELGPIFSFLLSGSLPAEMAKARQVRKWAELCSLRACGSAQVLVRHPSEAPVVQICVPKCWRDQVLEAFHGSAWAGHQGVRRTLERVRAHCWWPDWTRSVHFWVSNCWPCQAYKGTGKLSRWPTVWRERPPYPFHTIALDHFGPLPLSSDGSQYVLVIMDMYSGYVWCHSVSAENFNSAGTAAILVDKHATQHGTPCKLLSDRGSLFMASLSQAIYKQMGIRKLSTTAYNPECNGKCERFMQELAHMLAMVVDSAKRDWSDWLSHISFAHNTSYNRATGATPFLLATGREPRYAMHMLLGRLEEPVTAEGTAPSVTELVRSMLQRQRAAHDVANKRHALRQAKVLRENDALARAFGLRMVYNVSDKVWYYKAARTHSAVTDVSGSGIAVRTLFSKKLLDRWEGPYSVLAVGPSQSAEGPVQAGVLLVDLHGRPTRITAKLTKLCRDPTDAAQQPESLPTGFARYLIAKHWHGLSPGSLTAEDVIDDTAQRHGIEAILSHRVAAAPRGRGRLLQYLVRWESAGDAVADSWEDAEMVDSAPSVVRDYWATLSTASEVRGREIEGSGTEVVRQQLRRVSKVRGVGGVLAACREGAYTLAPTASAVVAAPSAAAMCSEAVQGMHILAVYRFTEPVTGRVYSKWCEGEIIRPKADKGRTRSKGSKVQHSIFWVAECVHKTQALSLSVYACDAAAPEGSWFLFGTRAQVDAFAGAH